ncbi:MAG: hypothetical protein AB7N91_27480 [Candidatus Tectimicrobiota bacterium]
MQDLKISQDRLHLGERFAVSFQRTLRIPDDGRTYPLPPGLGRFPLYRVADFADRVPPAWHEPGGVFIPMYQREALWLGFHAAAWKPNAVQVAIGRVNAISGASEEARLHAEPQDYVVCPAQPWLDGIHTGPGTVRQFVAMPLGLGYTVEASLTDTEQWGGLQITVFEPQPGRFPETPPVQPPSGPLRRASLRPAGRADQTMGLGAGGVMQQKIYPDPYGIDTWDQDNYQRVVIHILNSAQFAAITGMAPPPTPIDAQAYTASGFPWFALYDENARDVPVSAGLTEVKTITERDAERGIPPAGDASFAVSEAQMRTVRRRDAEAAREQSPSEPEERA